RLRILAEQHSYKVGDDPKIRLHWREQPALALVTFEGASVLGYKLVRLDTGDNDLTVPMESGFAPNFFLSVAVMEGNRFHWAQSEFRVSQELNVVLKPNQEQLEPGDDLSVEIQVTDPQGNPVQTELSLALIQTNLLNMFDDVQGTVNALFSSGTRQTSVRQSTSCTFSYQPKTRSVSQFLLAEADRRATLEREVRALAELNEPAVVGDFAVAGVARIDVNGGVSLDDEIVQFDVDFAEQNYANIAGDVIQEDFYGRPGSAGRSTQWAAQVQTRTVPVTRMRTETRTRSVPVTSYRTEIRDGRSVQVPYTEMREQSYAVSVPYTEQVEQSYTVQVPHQYGGATNRYAPTSGGQAASAGAIVHMSDGAMEFAIPSDRLSAAKYKQSQLGQLAQQTPRSNSPWGLGGIELGLVHGANAASDANLNWFDNKAITVNGLTNKGQFLAVNGRGEQQVRQLVREAGLQILPQMAHAETAFWDPAIVTDKAGKATVTIRMPARSTAWRLRAKGINSQTLAGEATADVITQKQLFGEMKLPLVFTVGDKPTIPVEIHHSIDGDHTLNVTLKATLGEKSTSQSKSIDVQGPGITDITFPIEISDAQRAVFELSVTGGDDFADQSTRTVAVRPYGFPVYQTASGTSSQSTLALIDFDRKLSPNGTSLEILIGSDVHRALLESVTDGGYFPIFRCGLPSSNPIERSVSDVLGGIELLKMIGGARDNDTPQAQAVAGRITAAVGQLVSAQGEKGGWSWTAQASSGESDSLLSSRVMWALSAARNAGFAVAQDPFSQGKAYLKTAFAATAQGDLERQTILLHAMAVAQCGDFSFANRLYRERNRLSVSGRIHLALTLAEMDRDEMAGELVDMIQLPTDETDIDAASRQRILPWMRNRVELQAMYLLAIQEVKPGHPDGPKLAKSIMAARVGSRWPVEKANGPAIAALARWNARAQNLSEKYKLTVSVNDRELKTLVIDPATDGSQRIEVPMDILHADKTQRIEFQLDGRATFSYSAVLTGFVDANKITSTTRQWTVSRRYEPAQRMFDGRPVPRGFQVVNGSYRSFTNPLTQLAVGDRGQVTLSPRRHQVTGRIGEQYDYLVLTESIPPGCTVLDGSVSGAFERYEIEPGQITFHIGNRRYPGDIQYTLIGYIPGQFNTPQSILRSFYEPSQFAVSNIKALQVLESGKESVDEYRLTPDELYYLGEKEFAKDNFDAAHQHLTQLYDNWRLDNDKYKNAVNWLFSASLAKNNHGDSVKYFEVLKEKFPEVEISFEDILNVAKSYRELGEYERSYLVYRATVEGSFERESQVAGFLNARGEFVRSVQAMERILRDYPAESYVATATYALAQETYRRAPTASEDAKFRESGITRVHLIDGAIKMLDHFVTTWPEDPADDQASFALSTALLDLEKYESAIERSEKYAERYPKSRLLDSFWYIIGYSHFELEHPQEALKMCRKVAEATFPVAGSGGTRPADNRWEAIYIMGQIYHSLGQAADAIAQYAKVKERFADATEAIMFFNRQEISLDEVTTIEPDEDKVVELQFRNVSEAAIKVYRIDLMKFGLMQRNLDRITAINLAGIRPYHEETVNLGDGKDYRDRTTELSLPLNEEGAYLIVCRGDNLYASGLALVSPLTLSVEQDATSGRVRVSVKNATNDKFVSDVHVKVIGSANNDFNSGETDLRGLFIADDVQGTTTVIAVNGDDRYAFYRGDVTLQPSASTNEQAEASQVTESQEPAMGQQLQASPQMGKDALRGNLFQQNRLFQTEQQGNYEGLLNNGRKGVKSKEAY
ncbi:MAG: tetratricopeptide repeat protein, partial [Pirellulaceae bacterium]|nr:tetratricopeptide repeat protein [Pirellulaceae bacterium]